MAIRRISVLAVVAVTAWLVAGVALLAAENPPPSAVGPFDATKANQHQKAWARHLKSNVEVTNCIGMKLMLIPAGEMSMGSPAAEAGHLPEELLHKVRVTKPYYLGKFEVTQKDWLTVMGSTPWKGKPYSKEGETCAVTYLSWDDTDRFCKKLSQFDGNEYRLPTEAEWEFAARGGTASAYSFGDNPEQLASYGWYIKNAEAAGQSYPHPVGELRANPFGLHDMHGNVWEWCRDLFIADLSKFPVDDPYVGIRMGGGPGRVIRGGFFGDVPANLRSSRRSSVGALTRLHTIGFRVLVEAKPGQTFKPLPPRLIQLTDNEIRQKLIGTTWTGKEVGGEAPLPEYFRKHPRAKVTCWTEYDADGTYGGMFEAEWGEKGYYGTGMWGNWEVFNGMIVHTNRQGPEEVFALDVTVRSRIVSLTDKTFTFELSGGSKASHSRSTEKIEPQYLSKMRIVPDRKAIAAALKEITNRPESDADKAIKKRIVGRWEGREAAGIGIGTAVGADNNLYTYNSRTIYKEDGTFQAIHEMRYPGYKPRISKYAGKWKVHDGKLIHIFTEGDALTRKGSVGTHKITSLEANELKFHIDGIEKDSVQRRVK